MLSDVSKIIQSDLLSFCGNFFYQNVVSKIFKLIQILRIKYDSLRSNQFPWLALYAVDGCHENKLVPSFIKTHHLPTWRLKTRCRFAVSEIINIDKYLFKLFENMMGSIF